MKPKAALMGRRHTAQPVPGAAQTDRHVYLYSALFLFLLKWKKYEYSSSFIFQGISIPAGALVGFDQFPSPL